MVIGPGSKELLFLLQLVLDADLLVPTPCWVTYPPQSRMAGRQPWLLHTRFDQGWLLDPGRAVHGDSGCEAASSPGVQPSEQPDRSDLWRSASRSDRPRWPGSRDLLIFSDEIYGHLDFRGEHRSMSRFFPEGTIVGSGLSKWCGAGGWRLGTFLFPELLTELQRAVRRGGQRDLHLGERPGAVRSGRCLCRWPRHRQLSQPQSTDPRRQ